MKRTAIIGVVVLAMIVLLGLAMAADCLRIAENHRSRIRTADSDLRKHEERLVVLLRGSPQLSPEVESTIAVYEAAKSPPERQAKFDDVVAAFRQTMGTAMDPTNPLDRKFMDDVAGAINRRQIARDPFDVEVADYREFLNSFRGRVARTLSSQAQMDQATGGE